MGLQPGLPFRDRRLRLLLHLFPPHRQQLGAGYRHGFPDSDQALHRLLLHLLAQDEADGEPKEHPAQLGGTLHALHDPHRTGRSRLRGAHHSSLLRPRIASGHIGHHTGYDLPLLQRLHVEGQVRLRLHPGRGALLRALEAVRLSGPIHPDADLHEPLVPHAVRPAQHLLPAHGAGGDGLCG